MTTAIDTLACFDEHEDYFREIFKVTEEQPQLPEHVLMSKEIEKWRGRIFFTLKLTPPMQRMRRDLVTMQREEEYLMDLPMSREVNERMNRLNRKAQVTQLLYEMLLDQEIKKQPGLHKAIKGALVHGLLCSNWTLQYVLEGTADRYMRVRQ